MRLCSSRGYALPPIRTVNWGYPEHSRRQTQPPHTPALEDDRQLFRSG